MSSYPNLTSNMYCVYFTDDHIWKAQALRRTSQRYYLYNWGHIFFCSLWLCVGYSVNQSWLNILTSSELCHLLTYVVLMLSKLPVVYVLMFPINSWSSLTLLYRTYFSVRGLNYFLRKLEPHLAPPWRRACSIK
jgi:hypothetical protein